MHFILKVLKHYMKRLYMLAYLYFFYARKKDIHFFIVCNHIGDSIISFGYLPAFLKKHKIENYQLVITKMQEDLLCFYPFLQHHQHIASAKSIQGLLTLSGSKACQFCMRKFSNITMINPASAFVSEFDYIFRFPNITLKDCIKYGDLALTVSDGFIEPDTTNLKKNLDIINGKPAIVLCPYATVTEELPMDLWERLTQILIESKYTVFTNVAGKQKAILKTHELRVAFDEICEMGEKGTIFIGLRSGLLDLLMYTNCKIIALYPQNDKSKYFFSLSMLENVKALYYETTIASDESSTIHHIIDLVNIFCNTGRP